MLRLLHSDANPFEVSRDPNQVLREYGYILRQNTAEAVSLRPSLYDYFRATNYENVHQSILSEISPEERHLFDCKFLCDFLIATDSVSLVPYLKSLSSQNTVFAETLLNYSVQRLVDQGEIEVALRLFAETLMKLNVEPTSIGKYNHGRFLKSLALMANSKGFGTALAQLSASNRVLASRLASAVLKHFLKIQNERLIKETWHQKKSLGLLLPRDLHWIMYFYVYIGEPATALQVYDGLPDLQTKDQTDALLIASAKATDWNRLQATFEQIDIHSKTDTNYEITLRALGELGGPEILDQIYDTVTRASPLIPLKVYHSLLYSYGRIGNIGRVKEIFERLCEQHNPTRLSFSLVLSAMKNSPELEYAQEVVAKMVGDYQIPMSDKELSLILTNCGARKDYLTARSVFKWASKLFQPDLASWNAYIKSVAYDGDSAYQVWKKMPHTSDIITLTSVLAPYARYGHSERVKEIVEFKRKLGLKSDLQWLGTILMYQCQVNAVEDAEKTFKKLRKLSPQLPGGYYTALMNLYNNQNKLSKAQELFKLMYDSNVVAGMDFYSKYLRVIMRLDHQTGVELAYKVVINMFKEDAVYDMSSRQTPRANVPSAVVQPIVRGLIRTGQFDRASELLTLTENQELPIADTWTLAALRIELLHAMDNPTLVSFYWVQFTEKIKKAFVPVEQDNKIVHRLPPNVRHTFWRVVNIELERLVRLGRFVDAINYPEYLEKMGLEMNTKNWNFLLQSLATCKSEGMIIEAYNISERVLAQNWLKSSLSKDKITPFLDSKSIMILHSSVKRAVQAISRKNSWGTDETWSKMLKLYPLTNNVFAMMKQKKAPRA